MTTMLEIPVLCSKGNPLTVDGVPLVRGIDESVANDTKVYTIPLSVARSIYPPDS